MNTHPSAGDDTFGSDTGYAQTNDTDYDRVTARDITDLLHHLAEMRWRTRDSGPTTIIDPTEQATFLSHKAELFTRIARQAERTRVDDYSRQVRQMATDAHAAAEQATQLQVPQPRMGPDQRRTPDRPPALGGAKSEENSGASSG